MAKQGYLVVGDEVRVIRPCWFYDQYFELNERFTMEEQHVNHGFEEFVVKVEDQ